MPCLLSLQICSTRFFGKAFVGIGKCSLRWNLRICLTSICSSRTILRCLAPPLCRAEILSFSSTAPLQLVSCAELLWHFGDGADPNLQCITAVPLRPSSPQSRDDGEPQFRRAMVADRRYARSLFLASHVALWSM